jgi:hypothetical protein
MIDWTHYKTDFDEIAANRARRDEDYERGLEAGNRAIKFHIGVNGVWATSNKDGSHTSSTEMLGYHANTAYFLRGVLDSGVQVMDHRNPGVKNRFAMLPTTRGVSLTDRRVLC